MPDPYTITLTTRDAGGLRGEAIQRFVPDSAWLLRMAEKENGCCISAGGWVARVKAAEREEAARHEKVVRLVMAARYAVGVCDKEIWNSENGGTVKSNQAIHGLHVALKEFDDIVATPTQTEAEVERLRGIVQEAEKDVAEVYGVMDNIDTTVANALRDLGLDTLAGTGFPWRVDALIDAAKEYKAELERLRRTVDERDSTIADLHVSLDAARLDAKRLERVLADLRAKLDALVGAVDGLSNGAIRHAMGDLLRHTSIPDHCLATLRLAADAARQPTEDR